VFVKVCGITTEEDALLAVAMGADAVGFVFAPSRRQLQPARARDIVRRLPPEILTVGVFRDDLPQRVVETVNTVGLRAAQLHGRERPEDGQYVAQRVPVLIKAFSAGDRLLDLAAEYGASAILVDSPVPGSGELFDWSALDGTSRHERLILAGGLAPDNVADAIRVVRPWGVDVSTGVESRPGHKDPIRVRGFINAAKAAADELAAHAAPAADAAFEPYDWRSEV
jgi:phosphoribosylanthranilate isomerase